MQSAVGKAILRLGAAIDLGFEPAVGKAQLFGAFTDDAFERLARPLPGERQAGYSPLVLELQQRNDRKVLVPRDVKVHESRWGKPPRKMYVSARAEPYAPQLIRLVRHPYALDTTWPRRERYLERRDALVAREPLPHVMREAVEARPDLYRRRPTEVRELPCAPWRPWQLTWEAYASEGEGA